MSELISVQPVRGAWAVKHGDGFLGFTSTEEEAVAIARHLVESASRHEALPRGEARSFAPAPRCGGNLTACS